MNDDKMNETENAAETESIAGKSKAHAALHLAKKGMRHALFPMVALVVFCLIVDETYPFSDFPMYSNLPDNTLYFYVADGEGEPLPVKNCFGVSASAMKKMYIKRLNKVAEERSRKTGQRISGLKLSAEDQQVVGDDLLDYLLPRGEKKTWWLENQPDVIRLVRVDIKRTDDEGLTETLINVVERSLKKDES